MALTATLTLTDNFGVDVTLTDLYVRVDRIDGGKQSAIITAGLYREAGAELVANSTYTFQPSVAGDASNFIAQAYEHLKALPEFEGAEDC
jgi:hypothetical protein